jgi:putative Mn2+ efflux pump MntP
MLSKYRGITLLLAAIGLSMDASAVSISNGMIYKNASKNKIILMAFYFGLFQALMPFLGYYAGSIFSYLIQNIDHWVVLIILSILGIKMIIEAVRSNHSETVCDGNCPTLTNKCLLLQAVATSIDAFAFGISLAVMKVDIYLSVTVIGLTTFLLCIVSFFAGQKFGSLFKNKAEIFGGIILILIGLKIFIEHMIA